VSSKILNIKFLKLKFIFLFILSSFIVTGQEHVVFEQLSTANGLSNGTIQSIFRDSRGFMWFCTDDGLNKYDGYQFTVYRSRRAGEDESQNIQFFSMAEDSYGRIWIGTSAGVYFYDQNNDRILPFSSYLDIDISNTPIAGGSIGSMFIDTHNYLWVSAFNGLSRVNISNTDLRAIRKEDITYYTDTQTDSLRLSAITVLSFYEDDRNQIWMTNNSNQIDCYNYERNTISHHKIDLPGVDESSRNNKKIFADNNGGFWISTEGIGLIHWERNKQKFTQIKSLSDGQALVDIRYVRSLMIDKLNRIWIGTDGNGLIVYNKERNEISHYSKNIEDQSNISSNAIYSIFEDPSGIVWVGTYLTGLNKFVSDKLSFGAIYSLPYSQTGLSHNLVTGFCEDKNGQIWISTDGGGVNLFDRKTRRFKHFKNDPNNPSSISVNSIMTLFCDNQNAIWIGSFNGGLNRLNQKTGKFDHFWHNPKDPTTISSNHPWGFAQDKWNNMWIASVDSGLNLMRPGSNTFVRYTNVVGRNLNPEQPCSNSITRLFIDKKNNLWICTERGLDVIDLNQVDFSAPKPKLLFKHYFPTKDKNSLSNYRVSYINEDRSGNMWIGTKGGGLNKLDIKNQTFKRYTVEDGLPHNIVNGILFDKNDNLWISTDNGLSHFNVETQKFTNYDTSDGLQSNVFIKTSCFKTSDGMFLFGGINGFNAFFPDNISSKVTNYNPVITDFKLFSQKVIVGKEIGNRILLPEPIFDMKKLHLFYNENSLTFEFSALDYSNPEKIFYSYKLEGFDKEWQITNAQMRQAKYTNLPHGTYTLIIKASTNEDIWPESGTSIKLIISPPWWKTKWFNFGAIIVVITILIAIYSVRINRLQKQKRILESKVEEKTRLLQAANNELSESNVMKDKFLSIIAHDLINPFSTILGFSDLLLNNYADMDEETRIETAKMINDSSNNLFELLGTLLQWSRSERGLLEYKPEKIDLSNCIFKITTLLSVSAQTKKINIDLKISEKCGQVKSDVQLLNAILRNLISNAIKFTPEGGQITIATEYLTDFVQVSVIDNGVGIAKDKLDNLFRIDVPHSTPGTNNEKGTGLGLVLVKEFVSKQLGTLKIESTVGKGSTFSFTIPVWRENPGE
jgi:signal transduction histidine kinase/ligand-binding sensor domain-containing protein